MSEPLTITMRAWAIDEYGAPMRMMNLPIPQPGPSDILIRMRGAEVGDWDEMIRTGKWTMGRPFPLALGLAGAGMVAAVGGEVKGFVENVAVCVYSYPLYDNGAWAEYMRVPWRYAARAPASLDLARAGAVPIAALTAHETLLDILEVHQEDVVLITAAAGGVGHFAVQIAAHLGAHVVATASRRNHAFVSALGAEAVIDYTSEDVAESILARYPAGVDKALNGAPADTANRIVAAMRDGGHIVDLPGAISEVRPGVRIDSDYVVRGDGARLGLLSRMIDDGRLQVEIEQVVSFEHARRALDTVLEKHVRGLLALKIA